MKLFEKSKPVVHETGSALSLMVACLVFLFPTLAVAWGANSLGPDNTHKRIVRQAADLLEANIDRYVELQDASDILQRHLAQLEKGGVAPDSTKETPYYLGADLLCQRIKKSCRIQNLHSDHFYDPDTHEGLRLSSVVAYQSNVLLGPLGDLPPEHAESQARRYIGIALAKWKDGTRAEREGRPLEADALWAEAVYWLGYASHYFSDLSESHHAANYPWMPLNMSHSEFEILVDARLGEILPEEEIGPNDWDYTQTSQYPSLTTLVTGYANDSATLAKSLLRDCTHGAFQLLPKAWKKAASITARSAVERLSLLYFRFLVETTRDTASLDELEVIGPFNVEIEMGKGFTPRPKEPHPSEAIALAIDFIDGQSKTWTLDTSNFYRWYAFNSDVESSYFMNWTDELPHLSEVAAVRLVRGEGQSTDPWEVEHLSLYIHGIRVLDVDGTMPLHSGGEISLPVPEGF
ncbi:MAG: zinc dependent phospholipase C family protein [Myxococcota bacterium]|nr:zinc dependent phospholipase C family protein [Myxococcota bacterium]